MVYEMTSKFTTMRTEAFFGCDPRNSMRAGDKKNRTRIRLSLNQILKASGYVVGASTLAAHRRGPNEGYDYWVHRQGEHSIDLQTWPEKGTVHFFVHYCGDSTVNEPLYAAACDHLANYFGAKNRQMCGYMLIPVEDPVRGR